MEKSVLCNLVYRSVMLIENSRKRCRNCYELIQKGYAISKKGTSSNHEHIRTIEELVSNDRGGIELVRINETMVDLSYIKSIWHYLITPAYRRLMKLIQYANEPTFSY